MTGQFDLSTLNWVKGEVDATLKEARVALEKFAEDPEDGTQLQFCAVHLHQVAGTLQMVELWGAALYAGEMERLADALPRIEGREAALEVLMRTILLLPDYLEILQGGQPDSALILQPLINELRRARGEKDIPLSALFLPDLRIEPPAAEPPPVGADIRVLAQKLRPRFQAALVKVLKGGAEPEAYQALASVLERIGGGAASRGVRQWFWIGGGLVEALRDGGLDLDASARQILGKFEQFIKQLSTSGESGVNAGAIETLVRASLFEIARAKGHAPRLDAVRAAFHLDALLPRRETLEQIRAALGGFNAETKITVSRDVMEELSRIKDLLDLLGRGSRRDVGELEPVAQGLLHIAGVLGLLQESALSEKLRGLAARIRERLPAGGEADQALLMEIAELLLGVESTLSDWGAAGLHERADQPAGVEGDGEAVSEIEAEHRRVVRRVMGEAREDLAKVREAINDFVQRPGEKGLLAAAPRQMREVIGSLMMLPYRRVARIVEGCRRFVERDLAADMLPPPEALDAFADAMVSVEYYLEAFVESRVHPASVLEVAERAVAKLGYPVDSIDEESLPPLPPRPGEEGEESDLPPAVPAPEGPAGPPLSEAAGDGQRQEEFAESGPNGTPAREGSPEEGLIPAAPPAIASAEIAEPVSTAEAALTAPIGADSPALFVEQLLSEGADAGRGPSDGDAGAVEDLTGPGPIAGTLEAEAATLTAPRSAGEEFVASLLREEERPVTRPSVPDAPTVPELMTIFTTEATDLLNASEELLQEWVVRPQELRPVEAIQRLLHTLKGSARWAGATPIVNVAHALESTLAAVVAGRLPISDEILHIAQRSQDHLSALLSQLKEGEEMGAVDELLERLEEFARQAKEADKGANAFGAPPGEVRNYDPELLDIFLEEGFELLNASDETLQAWQAQPDNRNLIEKLQRHLHTLKGGARMAGVVEIGDLGHRVESMLAAAADGIVPVTPAMVLLMQRAQDRLAVMLEQLRHHAPLPSGRDLIVAIDGLLGRGGSGEAGPGGAETAVANAPAAPPTAAVQPEPAEARDERSSPAVASDEEPSAPPAMALPHEPRVEPPAVPVPLPMVPEAAPEERRGREETSSDRRVEARGQYELVRVRSDLLDNMVNAAGEASIFRARIEQQIGAFRFNLEELNQVIERLRERLRVFGIETEAQIQSRYEEAASQGNEEFDPLELDRFTHMQQLSRSMIESLSDLGSLGSSLHNVMRETETLLAQQARVSTELQEYLMHSRMVPLVQNAPRLRRVVRQTCEELGKEAELRFKGAEVEMDRGVVERIMAPLEHLLRNAVVHGIESPEARRERGKPPKGQIVVHQMRDGSEVLVQVSDDGAGIDVEAVRAKAIARGLLAPDALLSDREIMTFILESGISTVETLSQIAGRGVGMDVVNSEVKNLNGSLVIDSERGRGTTFTIRLPLTLTVSRALLVYVGEDVYAIPLLSIDGIVRIGDDEIGRLLAGERPLYHWLGQDYEAVRLAALLGPGIAGEPLEAGRKSILLAHSGEHRVALVVDGLLGSREIVVKPIGRQLGSLRGISGATILGDGRVALILELPGLIRIGAAHRSGGARGVAPIAEGGDRPVVMVVDDSITVRKVTTRLLERSGMRAVAAKDGVEAIALLGELVPDTMLLDIEMPRMDGYELATHVRNDPRLRSIPIIMITSRSGEKHRQRAMQIGVDIYMTKPFQENELLENIRSVLAAREGAGAE